LTKKSEIEEYLQSELHSLCSDATVCYYFCKYKNEDMSIEKAVIEALRIKVKENESITNDLIELKSRTLGNMLVGNKVCSS